MMAKMMARKEKERAKDARRTPAKLGAARREVETIELLVESERDLLAGVAMGCKTCWGMGL